MNSVTIVMPICLTVVVYECGSRPRVRFTIIEMLINGPEFGSWNLNHRASMNT